MTITIANDPELPLSEAVFSILLCLAAGPRHGYAIMQETRSLSDGRVHLSTGTLYGALRRLLEQDMIAREPAGDGSDGRESKAYRLTERGWRIFRAEAARLAHLARLAQQRIAPEGGL